MKNCSMLPKINETLVHTLTLGIPKSRVLTRLLDLMEELLMYWSKDKMLLSSSKLMYHEERTYTTTTLPLPPAYEDRPYLNQM